MAEKKFVKSLSTSDFESIEIIDPGLQNKELVSSSESCAIASSTSFSVQFRSRKLRYFIATPSNKNMWVMRDENRKEAKREREQRWNGYETPYLTPDPSSFPSCRGMPSCASEPPPRREWTGAGRENLRGDVRPHQRERREQHLRNSPGTCSWGCLLSVTP